MLAKIQNGNCWRLPNIKELHSLVDYTRSPDTTNSAAIDPFLKSPTCPTASTTAAKAIIRTPGAAPPISMGLWPKRAPLTLPLAKRAA
jgi:hypothetical protein